MKIVIISDIHANLAALKALPEHQYDQLWCIGDLVDYGPNPHEVVDWVRANATVVVRGNHDYAAGSNADPQCSAPYKRLAAETLRLTLQLCTTEDLNYLKDLPLYREISVPSRRFYLVHATPTDPLFGYCPENSPSWREQVECIDAEVLVVGHTHTPFIRRQGKTTILNPGSVGQPKTGRPKACYAIWQDEEMFLKEYEYPIEETIRGIRAMPIAPDDQDALITVLRTGEVPARAGSNH
ncbi:MAG TPA: metallophosphoesterase family protein [Alloacidobacterium sp.]|nr:metallophosphoesterase family protein [Alloacidobacterium sp.]